MYAPCEESSKSVRHISFTISCSFFKLLLYLTVQVLSYVPLFINRIVVFAGISSVCLMFLINCSHK